MVAAAAAVAVGGAKARTWPDRFLLKIKECDQTATSAEPQWVLSDAGHQVPLLRLPEWSASFSVTAVIDSHIRPTTAAARSLVSPLRMIAHSPRPSCPPGPVVGGPIQGPPHALGSGAGQRLSRSGGGGGAPLGGDKGGGRGAGQLPGLSWRSSRLDVNAPAEESEPLLIGHSRWEMEVGGLRESMMRSGTRA